MAARHVVAAVARPVPRRGLRAGRARLAEIHRRSIEELKAGLAPELVEELDRIALPFTSAAPSDAELRIAQAQLVGWLEGLFHGIQTALFAQQMAAQQQLQGMRRALPPGHSAQDPRLQPQGPGGPQPPNAAGTGPASTTTAVTTPAPSPCPVMTHPRSESFRAPATRQPQARTAIRLPRGTVRNRDHLFTYARVHGGPPSHWAAP